VEQRHPKPDRPSETARAQVPASGASDELEREHADTHSVGGQDRTRCSEARAVRAADGDLVGRVTHLGMVDMCGVSSSGAWLTDRAAARFRAAYEAHAADVLAYAARRVAQPVDAHDVLADTMLVAWRRRAELPPDDEIRPWLFGVARRVLANQLRSSRRRVALDGRLEAALRTGEATIDRADCDEFDAVRVAMSRLVEDDRELLRLVAWEGLTSAEIAVVLGCRPAAVRKRLERARRRLTDAVEAADESHTQRAGHVPDVRALTRHARQETPDV